MNFVQISSSPVATRIAPLAIEQNVHDAVPRELPDVTGMMIVLLVTLGLFVIPVGATLMQGPQIVAGIFGG